MDSKLIGLFVLIVSSGVCSAYHRYRNYNHHHVEHEYEYSDDERTPEKPDAFGYDDQNRHEEEDTLENDEPHAHEEINIEEAPDIYQIPNLSVSEEVPPIKPRYEVTENVVDIPNPFDVRPIVTNFTITRPLNLATVNNSNTATGKRKPITGSTDEYKHEDMYNFDDLIPSLKNSFDGIKATFVNGVKKIGNDVLSVPLSYLNKIHRKANDVVRNVNSFFDHGHDDDDDEDFEQF